MVPPVVVYPETLSNQAFIRVNSPPHKTYGSIPKRQERIQARTIMVKPSFICISSCFLTKISGKRPVVKVITPLSSKGENAESKSKMTDTTALRNMNIALKSNAMPIFLATTLMFISINPVW
jgi:hypothetical protein